MNSKMEAISKKSATLAATAVFVNPFLHKKKAILGITFLTGKNYPDWHHLQDYGLILQLF